MSTKRLSYHSIKIQIHQSFDMSSTCIKLFIHLFMIYIDLSGQKGDKTKLMFSLKKKTLNFEQGGIQRQHK